uniref:Ethanolamine kinase n=1 Tax=Rhipicephalus appendiculatus TaxID=34631 RepID=A0A131YY01_RHIAP
MATMAMNHAEPSIEPASTVALASTVCAQNGAGEPPLDVVDVFVDGSTEASLREGALRVLQHVRPCWDLSLVQFKEGWTYKRISYRASWEKNDMKKRVTLSPQG